MDVRVSVLLPVLDEKDCIVACLESLESQDYPGPVEIVVADGGSTDGTLELLAQHDLVLVANPRRLQSHGLNLAAAAATGDILVRADAHTLYATDYLRRSVEALTANDVVAAGGLLLPIGTTGFGQAVAAAMQSRLGIGPAPFHHAKEQILADTVYLGAFRKEDFFRIGGFRTLPFGVAEDADLYWRWRERGERVLVDPAIQSVYRPRETPGALSRQFYRYGAGKADMLYVNGRWPSWRPLVPLCLVVGLPIGVGLATAGFGWPLLILTASWLAAVAIAGRARPAAMLAVSIMHLSYGAGLLRGLARRPSKVRAAVE